MSSIQDLAQGTLGGLASSGLPGIGIAAGIAAAGVGLIGGAIEGVGEQQERLKEQASGWADAYIEAGAKVLGSAQITERGLSILNDRQEEVTENAKNWGVAEETTLAAMAGSPTALADVETALKAKTKAAEADARAAAKVAEENGSWGHGPPRGCEEGQGSQLTRTVYSRVAAAIAVIPSAVLLTACDGTPGTGGPLRVPKPHGISTAALEVGQVFTVPKRAGTRPRRHADHRTHLHHA